LVFAIAQLSIIAKNNIPTQTNLQSNMGKTAFSKKTARPPKRTKHMIRENLYDVEAIVGERIGDSGEQLYLVKWEGYDDEESTWEPEDNIPGHFVSDWNESKENPNEMDLDVSDDDDDDDDTIHVGRRHIEIIDLTGDSDDENDEEDQDDDPDETNDDFDRVVIFINGERPTGADNDAAGQKDNSYSITNHEAIEIVGERRIPPLYKIRWRLDPSTGHQRERSWHRKESVGQSLIDPWKGLKARWGTVTDRFADEESDDEDGDNSEADEVKRALDAFWPRYY
jgi:hypothetical protein